MSKTFRLFVLTIVVSASAPLSLYFALLDSGSNTPGAMPLSVLFLVVSVMAFASGLIVITRNRDTKSAHQLAWLFGTIAAVILVWTVFEVTIV